MMMKKILRLINTERKRKPLLATAMLACQEPADGFGENSCCGTGETDKCSYGDECYGKGDKPSN